MSVACADDQDAHTARNAVATGRPICGDIIGPRVSSHQNCRQNHRQAERIFSRIVMRSLIKRPNFTALASNGYGCQASDRTH
jgi:hypothetical protein